jgi:hypothetical protein
LLISLTSNRHPGDILSIPVMTDMRAACHAYLDTLEGKDPRKVRQTAVPVTVSHSDEELERFIISLNRRPAAARALARVLRRAVEERK